MSFFWFSTWLFLPDQAIWVMVLVMWSEYRQQRVFWREDDGLFFGRNGRRRQAPSSAFRYDDRYILHVKGERTRKRIIRTPSSIYRLLQGTCISTSSIVASGNRASPHWRGGGGGRNDISFKKGTKHRGGGGGGCFPPRAVSFAVCDRGLPTWKSLAGQTLDSTASNEYFNSTHVCHHHNTSNSMQLL